MTIKLLVIDDDSAVTDLLSLLLRSQGFEVFATNNSTDGLNMIREQSPDLVILDLMMPEMDGATVLRALRGLDGFHTTPVVFLTAKSDPRHAQHLNALGASAILFKPFEPMTLANDLRTIWQRATVMPT